MKSVDSIQLCPKAVSQKPDLYRQYRNDFVALGL